MDRLIQGVFGAALVPLSQGTMLNIYPAEKRGSAMAMWGMGVMVGPILGPTLGGYLTELYNWRYVFFVNLPIGIAAAIGLWLFLPAEQPQSSLRFDWFGFTALAIGLAGLQLMLDRGETKDWFGSTEIIVEAVMAAAGFYLFLVHMLTAERPFITPAIFRDRKFRRRHRCRCSRWAWCCSPPRRCWRRGCRISATTRWRLPGCCWRRAVSAPCWRC